MKARRGIAWRVAACALAMSVSQGNAGPPQVSLSPAGGGLGAAQTWGPYSPVAAAPGSSEVSQAERMLFVEHHLQGLRAPTTLRYSLVKTGSLEPSSRDTLSLVLRADGDGVCCEATGGFAGDTPQMAMPPIEHAQANPAVLYFLERDVREMRRLTGGQPNYFRKRIRLSLAGAATLQDTTIRYQGRTLPAVEIRVSPYADDPMRARYARFASKQYAFVLADGVPGGVYQLRTSIVGPSPESTPVLQETLTLEDAKPGASPAPTTPPHR